MKTIDLEKIFEKHQDKFILSDVHYPKSFYIDAMREACNQAIDACAEICLIQEDKKAVNNVKQQIKL